MEINSEIRRLIELGTKAPSGHNSQPWKFKVIDDRIEIHPNFSCSLPEVDPSHRELYISLGCAGENICAAAPAFGYIANWSSNLTPSGKYSIQIDLKKAELEPDNSMPKLILERQSNRSIFKGKFIEEEKIDMLKRVSLEENINAYFFKKDSIQSNVIKNFIMQGNEIQMNDTNFKNELLSWIRFNQGHVNKTRNGLTYRVMGAPPMPKFLGKMIVKSFLKPEKQNKSDQQKIDSSSHFVLLTSNNNTPAEWIALGFSLERLLLKLTELGIANAYLNPPCEVDLLSDEFKNSLQMNGYPTIIMRIGYADKTPYSPRREVEEVLLNNESSIGKQ